MGMSSRTLNKIKKLTTPVFNSVDICFPAMKNSGIEVIFNREFSEEDSKSLTNLINLALVESGKSLGGEVTFPEITIGRSFGITHHTDNDDKTFLLCLRGNHYVFAYHKDKPTSLSEVAKCSYLEPGDVIEFNAAYYHSMYAYRPVKQPLEFILITA